MTYVDYLNSTSEIVVPALQNEAAEDDIFVTIKLQDVPTEQMIHLTYHVEYSHGKNTAIFNGMYPCSLRPKLLYYGIVSSFCIYL